MKKRVLAAVLALGMVVSNWSGITVAAASVENPVMTERTAEKSQVRETINFNTDWHYKKGDMSGAGSTEFKDEEWRYVNLPHSTTFYTAENKDAYLGISWYRKHFTIDQSLEGKKLLLTFEAVMQKAEVYINGELVLTHEGGYIPFVIDISDKIVYGSENVIALKTDSRPNASFAPGKDIPDFQYFGGIYGNSYLTVTDEVHITDAVEANETAGGGVFITAPAVSEAEATLKVKTHVENETSNREEVTLLTELLDENGSVVGSKEDRQELNAGAAGSFGQSLTVQNPALWSPDTPKLYTVRSTVKVNGAVKDMEETSYGIRKVEWKRDGLYINNKKMDVNGANLHGETYMFGNAMPDNAIYEEVKRFKENGFDIMRMSHYPHREAYYDACDKYGVMVVECASGWQYFNNADNFKNSTYQELRTDIRHKRNHPCIVAWETSLNESGYSAEWAQEMNRIAKEEYPTDGNAHAYTAGCTQWQAWDIGLSTPQAGVFRSTGLGAENTQYQDKPIIIAEYGDWSYGGTYSSTRVTREAVNDCGKKGGDEGMLIQADNIQESVQTNRSLGANWLGASMYWDYADYAGFDPGILTYCGVVDLYRIPKYGAYFYRSQRSADTDLSEYGIESGPMVYIANAWDSKADTEIRIFSNCDTVELFLNGVSLGEKGHDTTIWGPHGDVDPSAHPNGNGKEISAGALKNAPITFELDAYEAGELKAVGKINGEKAAEYVRKTPGQASRIVLRPESEAAVPLDGSSAKLVWIDITDSEGTVVTDAYTDVELEAEGPGMVVGAKTITTKGGQLAVWVKSKRGNGDITLKASADGLNAAEITIPTEAVSGLPEVPEGGDADEYEVAGQEDENVFLNKSVRASSENANGGTGAELAGKANDGEEGTKWCAGSGSYPQWWEVDLGSEYLLKTIQMSFETAEGNYHYTIAVSNDPMTEEDYAEHIVLDHSAGSTETGIAFEEAVKGRYVRITFTEAYNNEWAVLREVSGTGIAKNVALNKAVSASTVNTGQSGEEKAEYAVDGNQNTQWCAKGGAGTSGHWFQVDLGDTYHISDVNLMFEKDDAAYKFVLQGSVDGKHYRDIKDLRVGDGCGQISENPVDEIIQYLRIYDISTKDPASQWPAIKEIEVYGEKVEYHLENVAREKEAFASSNKEGGKPGDGNNGVPGWYWYPADQGEAWWYVDMKGIYDLDNVQMTWNAAEEHRYLIDISMDGKTWTNVVDRSKTGNSEIQPYEPVKGTARFVRVRLPEGRASSQGFGLFAAYGKEAEKRSVKEILPLQGIETLTGTAFEKLALPKEIEVLLEDNTSMMLSVIWNQKDYDSSKEGKIVVKGELSAIPGVLTDSTKKAEIEILLKKAPSADESDPGANQTPNQTPDQKPSLQVTAGYRFDSGSFSYQVTSATSRTVQVTALKKSAKTVKVFNTVTLDGKSYKVTSVAPSVFKNNKKIKTVVIGTNVTSIGSNAFSGCTSLKKVTIGKSVKSIGKKAFYNCKKLTDITYKSTKVPKIGKQAFKGIGKKCRITVPKKMKKKQLAAVQRGMKKAGAGSRVVYRKK